ncbi:hypothetical protein BST97_08435 [Nonlabens spongiae]|uniref:Right handed beta helix domain-containing protein n=1 Tax=Nonlabens spongiae TaxID=331648 RepID=A0A1W6MKA4_9FLAO|nr:hypothetical protein [Nonlabens spongiae]ARN78025.1 hypothetical protein BST97_08435 [Nonlabens spongiae]
MKNLLTTLTTALMLFNAITLQAQTTITVDNTPGSGAQFSDIQSAVDAASNGDTIYVQQSQSNYGVVVVDKPVTIIGRSALDANFITRIQEIRLTIGSDGTIIRGVSVINGISTVGEGGANPTTGVISNITITECTTSINLGSDGSSDSYDVQNITLSGINHRGIDLDSTVSNVLIDNSSITALSASNPSALLVSNCIFEMRSTSQPQIINSNVNGTITITNTIFEGPVSTLRISGNYSLSFCLLVNVNDPTNPVTVEPNTSATNNVNNCIFGQDPLFVLNGPIPGGQGIFTTIPDFNLQTGSPAIGAGFQGENIGYESTFNFKRLGKPRNFPEVKITNFTNISQPNGTLTFEIQATSH